MTRLTLVTNSKDGVGSLRYGGAVRTLNGDVGTVLNISLMGSATMFPPSGGLHNVFLVDRCEGIPDKSNITVRGALEKSWSTAVPEPKGVTTGSARSHRHSSQPLQSQGRSTVPPSQSTFLLWHLDLLSLVIRMHGRILR